MNKLLAIAFILALGSSAMADPGITHTPLGYQQITLTSSAVSLTVPAGATSAVITAHTQAVRYRDDGTAPTATVGMPVAVDQPFTYSGTLSAIKFFAQTTGAELDVSYYH